MSTKQLLPLGGVFVLLFALFAGLVYMGNRQTTGSSAVSSGVKIFLEPLNYDFKFNERKSFVLKATFTGGSTLEKLVGFRTEVNFSPQYLKVPDDWNMEVAGSGFSKKLRIDGPTAANQTGKITIEIASTSSNDGPSTADTEGQTKTITIGTIDFIGIKETPSTQQITLGGTQAANSLAKAVTPSTEVTNYTVGASTIGGPYCQIINFYDSSGKKLTEDIEFKSLRAGDKIQIAVKANAASATKAKIRIKQGTTVIGETETDKKKPNTGEFYIDYELPSGTPTFTVEAEVFDPASGGWR